MAWLKRIFFFVMLNAAILTMISIVLSLFGIQGYLTPYGISYKDLMAFCLLWGIGGAFISLALSKTAAKWIMGVQILDVNTSNPEHKWLVDSVHKLAKRAGLKKMPAIGIFESKAPNAFATGPSRRNSLVAVSNSLMNTMEKDEVLAVIGHEVAHIANGDMVTMTLLQGIINAFVMFLARALAHIVSSMLSGRSRNSRSNSFSPMLYFLLTMVFQSIFMFFGYMVIAAYSRLREYRADLGGAQYAGKMPMIGALKALKREQENALSKKNPRHAEPQETGFEVLQISSDRKWLRLLSTHPPLEDRISRLEQTDMSAELEKA